MLFHQLLHNVDTVVDIRGARTGGAKVTVLGFGVYAIRLKCS